MPRSSPRATACSASSSACPRKGSSAPAAPRASHFIRSDRGPTFDNAVASIGPDGTLLVDAVYARTADSLLAALARAGGGGPKVLINTHYHHAGGNAGVGRGSVVVFFTGSRVVATGDPYVPMLGVCDWPNGCRWNDFGAGVRRLAELVPEDAVVLPGHGPASNAAELRQLAELLEEMTVRVRRAVAAGRSREQVVAEGLPARWAAWADRGIPVDFSPAQRVRRAPAEQLVPLRAT